MEGVVADVFLQAFGGAGTVGQVAQDDGDDAGGVVDDFGVVFEVAVQSWGQTPGYGRLFSWHFFSIFLMVS